MLDGVVNAVVNVSIDVGVTCVCGSGCCRIGCCALGSGNQARDTWSVRAFAFRPNWSGKFAPPKQHMHARGSCAQDDLVQIMLLYLVNELNHLHYIPGLGKQGNKIFCQHDLVTTAGVVLPCKGKYRASARLPGQHAQLRKVELVAH